MFSFIVNELFYTFKVQKKFTTFSHFPHSRLEAGNVGGDEQIFIEKNLWKFYKSAFVTNLLRAWCFHMNESENKFWAQTNKKLREFGWISVVI